MYVTPKKAKNKKLLKGKTPPSLKPHASDDSNTYKSIILYITINKQRIVVKDNRPKVIM